MREVQAESYGLLIVLLFCGALFGCTTPEPCPAGEECTCASDCDMACEGRGCRFDCKEGAECSFECYDGGCYAECFGSTCELVSDQDIEIRCGTDSSQVCFGVGCVLECG